MIIWFNCKITDQRLNPHTVVRYNLKNDNRFDVARYSFASFVPLEPLVTKFIFNLELADEHKGREQEMETWLKSLFPASKLELNWHRVNNVSGWREISQKMAELNEQFIFPAGNEDHIYLDYNTDVFKKGLELLAQDSDPYATLMTSHYPESIRATHFFNGDSLSECGNYVNYTMENNDAIRVMKKEYFDWYVNTAPANAEVYRTEHWNNYGILRSKMYIPTREQFRHFDGYAHVGVGPEVCPPLEIPAGFFDGMTIRYGFDGRHPNCVNINPLAENLYTVDHEKGADYKYTLDRIPAFWKPAQIITAPDLNEEEINKAYDVQILNMTRIDINWWHVGARFDDSNWPPSAWLNNHAKYYQFYDNIEEIA